MKVIDLAGDFNDYVRDWREELKKDEWFFTRFRKRIVEGLSPEEAYATIPDAVGLVLVQEDQQLCIESFEILLELVKLSDTTEMHEGLLLGWDELLAHVSSFGDYHRRRVNELATWYRIR